MMVIGSGGFIGRHFCKMFPHALAIGRHELDLAAPSLPKNSEGVRYALVTAGIGNPRKVEADPEKSYRCNVSGTLSLGKELLKRGILPIFFSTDYVLNDALEVAPLNTYGHQKAELEREGEKMGALVIRLSKVYGVDKGDGSLFDEMVSMIWSGGRVRAARDQIFSPIFVRDVIERVVALAENGATGVVNVVGPSYASRYEMAERAASQLGKPRSLVEEISLDDLKDGVCRPKELKLKGDFPALSWQEGLQEVIKNYAS